MVGMMTPSAAPVLLLFAGSRRTSGPRVARFTVIAEHRVFDARRADAGLVVVGVDGEPHRTEARLAGDAIGAFVAIEVRLAKQRGGDEVGTGPCL